MKTLIFILLCSCATGVSDPLPPEPTQTPQKPAPTPDETVGTDANPCVIIKTVWGGNCRFDEYQCKDGSIKFDGKCYPPDWVPPHSNDPDPPFRGQ